MRLPRAWWDADLEMVLCDPSVVQSRRLQINSIPVALSYGVFTPKDTGEEGRKWVLVDMDAFEEGVCEETGTLVVKDSGKGIVVVRLEKNGGGRVGVREMRELVGLAAKRCKEWRDVVDKIR